MPPRITALLTLVLFSLAQQQARAQVTYDGNAQCVSSASVASTLSIPSFPVPAGTNQVLVVLSRSTSNQTVRDLTFRGQSLTRLGSPVSNAIQRAEIWFLPLFSSTSSSPPFPIEATYTGNSTVLALTAATFSRVDQFMPLDGLVSNGFGASASSSTLSSTGAAGDMAIEAISAYTGAGTVPPSFTPTAGQTLATSCSASNSTRFTQAAAYKVQSGGSQPLTWSASNVGTGPGVGIQIAANLRSAAPLPVQLTAFTAEAADAAAVRLAWATATEKNSARFEVERSQDGSHFAQIGAVAAAGSSVLARTYAFADAAAPAGRLYYRLRQVDADGTATYSPVHTVDRAPAAPVLVPNPTRTNAQASGLAAGAAVEVFDALGRSVLRTQADAAGQAALVLPAGLPAGMYVVRAGNKNLRLTVEE